MGELLHVNGFWNLFWSRAGFVKLLCFIFLLNWIPFSLLVDFLPLPFLSVGESKEGVKAILCYEIVENIRQYEVWTTRM